MRIALACLLAACGGGGSSSDGNPGVDAAAMAGTAQASLRLANDSVVEIDGPATFLINGGVCGCTVTANEHRVSIAWSHDVADATGTFPTDASYFLVVDNVTYAAKFQAMGTITFTQVEPGRSEGTIVAPTVSQTGSRPSTPIPAELKVVEIVSGAFACVGPADGVNAGCWQ